MNTCKNCNKPTKNPKFCNRSCAAIYNNTKCPKRKGKNYYCKHCKIKTTHRRTTCDTCNPSKVDWSKRLLKDFITNSKHLQHRYSNIREAGKRAYKNSSRPENCEKCNYKLHYEICHIKPIYMFDLKTPISIINDLSNLVALCPNCHWEMDNGLWQPGL